RTSYADALSPDLIKRELALDEQIVKTATKRPPNGDTAASWEKIGVNLAAKGFSKDDLTLISATNLDPSKHARYCDAMIIVYRTIAGLPSAEAAVVLRDIFSGRP